MKKRIVSIIAVVAIALTLMTACSGKTSIRLATGGTSGTYYAYSGIVAQILSKKVQNVDIKVQSTGASMANIQMIADGEAEMAIVQNDVMYYAYNGTDLFAETGKEEGFSAMAACYAEVCQIVAAPSINSVEDLKGKRVSVGDAGSGVEFNARQILEAYGLSFDDIIVSNLSFGDSADSFKDNKIDAFFCTAGAPTTAIVDLATTNAINVVEIDDEHAAALIDKYPFYSQHAIPANSYNGVGKDAMTVAVKATYIVSDKLSEDVVYSLTKALFENKGEITSGHAKGAELDINKAVEGISIPLHPGAEKYYKEVGVIK